MTIGEKIYELRKAQNLSQEELAENLGVTRQTVSKWETNQSLPELDKVMPLCTLFGISVEELLSGTPLSESTSLSGTSSSGVPAATGAESGATTAKDTSTDEKRDDRRDDERGEERKAFGAAISSSVLMYFFSVAFLIVAISVFGVNPVLVIAIFLCVVGFATVRIIQAVFSAPQKQKAEVETLDSLVRSILWTGGVVVYLLISFATGAWYITWIIFPILAVVELILKLMAFLRNEDEVSADGKACFNGKSAAGKEVPRA